MINVNLLPPKHVFTQKEREIRRKTSIFLAVFSAVFLVVFGFVLGGNLYFSNRLAAYDVEQKHYQDKLSELSQLGWSVSSIGFKVAGIKLIRNTQHSFATPIANIRDLTSGVVEVSHVELSPNYEVIFSGTAKGRDNLEAFLTKFTQNNPETKFLTGVSVKDLQQQENAQFAFSVIAKYLPSLKD